MKFLDLNNVTDKEGKSSSVIFWKTRKLDVGISYGSFLWNRTTLEVESSSSINPVGVNVAPSTGGGYYIPTVNWVNGSPFPITTVNASTSHNYPSTMSLIVWSVEEISGIRGKYDIELNTHFFILSYYPQWDNAGVPYASNMVLTWL